MQERFGLFSSKPKKLTFWSNPAPIAHTSKLHIYSQILIIFFRNLIDNIYILVV